MNQVKALKRNYGEVHKKNIENKQCKTNSEKTDIENDGWYSNGKRLGGKKEPNRLQHPSIQP